MYVHCVYMAVAVVLDLRLFIKPHTAPYVCGKEFSTRLLDMYSCVVCEVL